MARCHAYLIVTGRRFHPGLISMDLYYSFPQRPPYNNGFLSVQGENPAFIGSFDADPGFTLGFHIYPESRKPGHAEGEEYNCDVSGFNRQFYLHLDTLIDHYNYIFFAK